MRSSLGFTGHLSLEWKTQRRNRFREGEVSLQKRHAGMWRLWELLAEAGGVGSPCAGRGSYEGLWAKPIFKGQANRHDGECKRWVREVGGKPGHSFVEAKRREFPESMYGQQSPPFVE